MILSACKTPEDKPVVIVHTTGLELVNTSTAAALTPTDTSKVNLQNSTVILDLDVPNYIAKGKPFYFSGYFIDKYNSVVLINGDSTTKYVNVLEGQIATFDGYLFSEKLIEHVNDEGAIRLK
jgi:hypothetical protein